MDSQPLSRYAGGKRELLPEILARMPKGFNDKSLLHEWFAGGAALFWHLTSPKKPQRAILCDTNPAVTCLYVGLQRAASADIYAEMGALRRQEEVDGLAQTYAAARDRWNAMQGWSCAADAVALVLYLNRRGFNGLWRVNASGEYNVPAGKWKSRPPALPSLQDIQTWACALGYVSIRSEYTVWRNEMPGSVVFADPPYLGGFVQYTRSGFSEHKQRRLALDLREAEEAGATVIATNSPAATSMYEVLGFKVEETSRGGNMNSKTTARQRVGEVIIT